MKASNLLTSHISPQNKKKKNRNYHRNWKIHPRLRAQKNKNRENPSSMKTKKPNCSGSKKQKEAYPPLLIFPDPSIRVIKIDNLPAYSPKVCSPKLLLRYIGGTLAYDLSLPINSCHKKMDG